MDYVVGSIAALISGNVTPNRPKLIRRALTPTKHPVSPNVTPKSEAVDDRSIFLSPSVQKKKAIVKKSPKRIFENPDLDVTENSEITSPKADKVKKHLVEDLESGIMGKSSILVKKSPSSKVDKSMVTGSPNKKSKIIDAKVSNESTPKKKKRNSQSATDNKEINSSDITKDSKSPKTTASQVEEAAKTSQTPKKNKKESKSETNYSKPEVMEVDQTVQAKSPKKKLKLEIIGVENKENQDKPTEASKASPNIINTNEQGSKKKNKKHKKKLKKINQEESVTKSENAVKQNTTHVKATSEGTTETKNQKKKKNRKNKKKKPNLEIKPPKQEEKEPESEDDQEITKEVNSPKNVITKEVDGNESDNESDDDNEETTMEVKALEKIKTQEVHGYESSDNESSDDDDDDDSEEEEEEVSNIANPNAITEKDSDSEHDSDNEIESDIETSNAEALQTEKGVESSDDEELPKKGKTKKAKEVTTEENNEGIKEVNTEDEIKRTLFVGNVPFSSKCKKEIKKIFAQYGEIETVRIRTVPVKDGRVTPKLAVIRNEIHPDRSTVNVYIKFGNPDSVERALCENNTVLNDHHLRVTRSGATGVEHSPACAVFVGNLPFGIEDETLRSKFEGCGEVQSVRIVRDKKTNAGKGFGYVNFATKDAVELALELSEEDLTVKNRIMRVKRCTMTLSKGPKKGNQSVKPQRNFDNLNRNSGNNQGQNRNFGNNQAQNRSFGNNQGQNRNFGNNGPNRGGRNNQGPSRSFGNNQRNFGNQGQRNFGNNQGQNRNFGNNQGRNSENQGRSFGDQGRSFGNQGRSFGKQGNEASGAARRLMNKRPHQEGGDGPANKRQIVSQPQPPREREKKQRKEFVGITAEKKKKQKFDKTQKKKKALSEILTKKRD